jgi:lipoate-protein ligase A
LVTPWLPEISLFDDIVPHAAALNMGIDEALLKVISGPVLRVYRWTRPAVSFGYFERWEPVRAAYPERDAVRRWTGGGVVLHGEDFTYSLLVPPGWGAEELAPGAAYGVIHGALCLALADAGIRAEGASAARQKVSQACFENPVPHDVMVDGRKVAGAAQRRTRRGLIHQGSVQGVELPAGFGQGLARWLAADVKREDFDVIAPAEKLAAEKYGTRDWMERRR